MHEWRIQPLYEPDGFRKVEHDAPCRLHQILAGLVQLMEHAVQVASLDVLVLQTKRITFILYLAQLDDSRMPAPAPHARQRLGFVPQRVRSFGIETEL